MVLLPGTVGAARMGGPVSLRGDRKHFWSWGMVGEVERVDFLANPLASQTRVDTEDTDDMRQMHKELGGCGSVDLSPPPPACYLHPLFHPASSSPESSDPAMVAALTWRFLGEDKQQN